MESRLPNRCLSLTRDLAAVLLLSGCGVNWGAPSLVLFGAFFPAWVFCATIGIISAIGARALFVGTGWSTLLPFQLFVCTSIGLICGVLAWLLWFGS